MARLIALLENSLGTNWRDTIEWLRDQNQIPDLEARLRSGNIEGIVTDIEAAAQKFAADTHAAYVTAGQTSAEWLDGQVADKLIRFDQVNHRAVAAARNNEIRLVSNLSDEQRTTVHQVIIDGQQRGANPLEVARDIRSSIGLTASQSDAVQSYRRALESGDYGNALGRELRDGRSDRTLLAAGRDDRALTADQVDAMTERYRANFVTHRAETIARTESLRNAHEGSAEAIRQAVERGDIEAGSLTTTWNAGPMTRYARHNHHKLDGKSVKYGETFDMGDGVRMRYPGDEAGGVANNANCRCAASTRLGASYP